MNYPMVLITPEQYAIAVRDVAIILFIAVVCMAWKRAT